MKFATVLSLCVALLVAVAAHACPCVSLANVALQGSASASASAGTATAAAVAQPNVAVLPSATVFSYAMPSVQLQLQSAALVPLGIPVEVQGCNGGCNNGARVLGGGFFGRRGTVTRSRSSAVTRSR